MQKIWTPTEDIWIIISTWIQDWVSIALILVKEIFLSPIVDFMLIDKVLHCLKPATLLLQLQTIVYSAIILRFIQIIDFKGEVLDLWWVNLIQLVLLSNLNLLVKFKIITLEEAKGILASKKFGEKQLKNILQKKQSSLMKLVIDSNLNLKSSSK